jgi:hypothetical protein
VDWKVRRELATNKNTERVVGLELQHPNRWDQWISKMQSNRAAQSWFGSHHYPTPQRAAQAVKQFFKPEFIKEREAQFRDYDRPFGPHRLPGLERYMSD